MGPGLRGRADRADTAPKRNLFETQPQVDQLAPSHLGLRNTQIVFRGVPMWQAMG